MTCPYVNVADPWSLKILPLKKEGELKRLEKRRKFTAILQTLRGSGAAGELRTLLRKREEGGRGGKNH